MQQRLLIPALLLMALGLSACGNKGPLVPREKAPDKALSPKPEQAPTVFIQTP